MTAAGHKDPAILLAKHERLKLEAIAQQQARTTRYTALQLALAETAERRAFATMFVNVAREKLSDADYLAICAEANTRRTPPKRRGPDP